MGGGILNDSSLQVGIPSVSMFGGWGNAAPRSGGRGSVETVVRGGRGDEKKDSLRPPAAERNPGPPKAGKDWIRSFLLHPFLRFKEMQPKLVFTSLPASVSDCSMSPVWVLQCRWLQGHQVCGDLRRVLNATWSSRETGVGPSNRKVIGFCD